MVCFTTRYGAWTLVGDYQRIMSQPISLAQDKAIRITFQAFIDAFQSSENLGRGGVFVCCCFSVTPPTSTN